MNKLEKFKRIFKQVEKKNSIILEKIQLKKASSKGLEEFKDLKIENVGNKRGEFKKRLKKHIHT